MQMLHYSIGIGPSPALHFRVREHVVVLVPPSFAHVSRVFSSHIFSYFVLIADQLKGGQQKYVMQMKMVAEWHGAIT